MTGLPQKLAECGSPWHSAHRGSSLYNRDLLEPAELHCSKSSLPLSWRPEQQSTRTLRNVATNCDYLNCWRQNDPTLTMAASKLQSGRPGLSIIPAVRYAMLSITKALRAISANFSCKIRANTDFVPWGVVMIQILVKEKSTIPESYQILQGFC